MTRINFLLPENVESYTYHGFDDLNDIKVISLGFLRIYSQFWDNLPRFYYHKNASGCDINNDPISKANHIFLHSKYSDKDGVYEVDGDYRSYGLLFTSDFVNANPKIADYFKQMDNGCTLHEATYDELVMELENDCWKNFALREFRIALHKHFDEETIDLFSDEQITAIFYDAFQHHNEGVHFENLDVIFPINAIVEYCFEHFEDIEVLNEYFIRVSDQSSVAEVFESKIEIEEC